MITVSIATMYERKKSLLQLVESLLPQADKINIYAHHYLPEKSEILEHPKVNIVYDYEYGDHGDLDKFFWVGEVKEGVHLILDDDLIIPDDYVKICLDKISEDNNCIYSFHGADIYKPPIGHYYRDRIVYPALGTVPSDIENPCIISTGVLFYDAGKIDISDFYDTNLTPNMADIHFSIYVLRKGYKTKIVSHNEGFIKHSDIDLKSTIYGQYSLNPYNMTKAINDNAHLFKDRAISYEPYYPKVSVVVVNTRLKTNPLYLSYCLESIRRQHYKNIELIFLDNEDKLITVGRAFNIAAEKATGEYVLYIGDDDYISPDYISSLVAVIDIYSEDPKVAGVSSYLTLFRENPEGNYFEEQRNLIPTGMWKRDIILKMKFKEYMTRYTDSEFADRVKEAGYKQLVVSNQYGYYYRSHNGQVSGLKVFRHEDGQSVNTEEVKEKLNQYSLKEE